MDRRFLIKSSKIGNVVYVGLTAIIGDKASYHADRSSVSHRNFNYLF